MADHFWPVGAANQEIQSLVLHTGVPKKPLNATGGAASAWRRRRRRLTFLAPPLGFARSHEGRAGSERGGDADVADGEESSDADKGRATDSKRYHLARLE